jgi:membrane-associated phospholipid phosphatase
VLGLAVLLGLSGPAMAQRPEPFPAAESSLQDLPAHLALTLGAGLGAAFLQAEGGGLTPTRCPCDRTDLPGFDADAVGLHRPGWERAADLAVALALVAPLALSALSAPDAPTTLLDTTRVLEAAALAALATQIAKVSSGRPYPYLYAEDPGSARHGDGVNYGSFWSGHTAVPMAAATAASALYFARHPRSPWRWVVAATGPALALLAGSLQVGAGNHFPSDVATGALVGAAIGLGTVWLPGVPGVR